ncbi:MAG: PAS domain-containing protein [Candidatus Accumulibacter propinquus]
MPNVPWRCRSSYISCVNSWRPFPARSSTRIGEGRYLGCNQAFLALLGKPRSAVIGATVYDLAPRDLADRYQAADDELFKRQWFAGVRDQGPAR